MSKRFLSLFLTVVVLLIPATSKAAILFSAPLDTKTNALKISGEAYGSSSLMVASGNLSPDVMSDANGPAIYRQIETNGVFSFDMVLPDDFASGKYVVYFSNVAGNAESTFVYVNAAEAERLIGVLKGYKAVSDKASFKNTITQNAFSIGIDSSASGFAENADDIYEFLYKAAFDNYNDFSSLYGCCFVVVRMSGANISTVADLIASNESVLGYSYSGVSADTRLSAEQKDMLLTMFSQADFKQYIKTDGSFSFADIAEEMKVLVVVNGAQYSGELKKIIATDFKAELAQLLANEKYTAIGDKDEVFAKLYEKRPSSGFASVSELENAFTLAVEDVYKSESTNYTPVQRVPAASGSSSVSAPVYNPVSSVDDVASFVGDFNDVTESHWCYNVIQHLAKTSIVSGFPDGSFRPNSHVTRAEFAKMIISFTDGIEQSQQVAFDDVLSGEWYYECISTAAGKGIIKGDGKSFKPNESIKREDAAVIIYRVLDEIAVAPIAHRFFDDWQDVSDYAREAVEGLGSIEIVNGNENGYFMPQAVLTRAEAAQLIYNAFVSGKAVTK